MEPKRSWWQKIKQHPYTTGIVLLLVLILFIFSAYRFGWDWTGFNSGTSQITITSTSKVNYTATVSQPSKSLWDWLQLLGILAIPVVAGVGAAWYTQVQKQRDKRLEQAQRDRDRQLANQQAESDRTAADQRAKTEREIAQDNQREAALQAYIDKMSELLLKEHLDELTPEGKPKPEYDEIRKIARIRTLTILHLLDSERKGSVLQFLYEAGLIIGDKDKVVIHLQGAELNGARLTRIFLNGVNLSRVDLNGANLYRAILTNAILEFADLRGANIREADLIRCDLSNADLTEADLSGAILIGANLRGAIGTTPEQLANAKSLQGATMPDGDIHP